MNDLKRQKKKIFIVIHGFSVSKISALLSWDVIALGFRCFFQFTTSNGSLLSEVSSLIQNS